MRTRFTAVLAFVVCVSACSSNGTGVLLTVAGSGVTADQLTITAHYSGNNVTHTVPGTARTLTFPTTVVLALPDKSTSVTIDVTATMGSTAVAGGTTSAIAVSAHQIAAATIDLSASTIPPDGGTGVCGKVAVLVDPFTTTNNDPLLNPYATGGLTGSEGGGMLTVTLPANATNGNEAGFPSQAFYDISDSAVSIELPQMVDGSTTAYAGFSVNRDDNNFLELSQESGTLNIDSVENKGRSRLTSIPYDPVMHRWMRIRESGGTVYLETAPDGTTWATQGMVATPTWVDYAIVNIFAGADGTVNNGGTAQWQQLNNGVATGVRCPSNSLTDDFSDGTRSDAWLPSESSRCTMTETGGMLDFALQTTPSDCEYISSYGYDMTGNSITVNVPTAPTQADGAVAWLRATVNELDASGYEISVDEGTLQFLRKNPDGSSTGNVTMPYDATMDSWWRISEQGGTISYQTSPDGKMWTTRASEPVSLPITAIRAHLGVSVYDKAATSPGHVDFASFNLQP